MSSSNGGIVGLGFRPNDEELVGYYLKNKSLGRDSLVQVISEVPDICNREPQDLTHLHVAPEIRSNDQVWYFFSPQIPNKEVKRTTQEGYWSITGKKHPITVGNTEVGFKRILVFYKGRCPSKYRNKRSKESTTPWVMHEYHLPFSATLPNQRHFVLCKLFKKDKSPEDRWMSWMAKTSAKLEEVISKIDDKELLMLPDSDEASPQERSDNHYYHLDAVNDGSNLLPHLGSTSICPRESARKRPRFIDDGMSSNSEIMATYEQDCMDPSELLTEDDGVQNHEGSTQQKSVENCGSNLQGIFMFQSACIGETSRTPSYFDDGDLISDTETEAAGVQYVQRLKESRTVYRHHGSTWIRHPSSDDSNQVVDSYVSSDTDASYSPYCFPTSSAAPETASAENLEWASSSSSHDDYSDIDSSYSLDSYLRSLFKGSSAASESYMAENSDCPSSSFSGDDYSDSDSAYCLKSVEFIHLLMKEDVPVIDLEQDEYSDEMVFQYNVRESICPENMGINLSLYKTAGDVEEDGEKERGSAVNLPQGNPTASFIMGSYTDENMARETNAKRSLKMHSDGLLCSKQTYHFFDFSDTPSATQSPPVVYFLKAVLGMLLFVAIVCQLI